MDIEKNSKPSVLKGKVVYIFAFDVAYDMKRDRLVEFQGRPLEDFSIGPSKKSPKQIFFYRPQMLRLPDEQIEIGGNKIDIQRRIKIFNIGAISIQVSVPFEVERIEQLVNYHDLDVKQFNLEQQVKSLADDILGQLTPFCIRPVTQLGQPEAYTIFCFEKLLPADKNSNINAEGWFKNNRRKIAALLAQEDEAEYLSEQEAAESTKMYLTYYQNDLVVVDWDAAIIVGEEDNLDDVLHIIELANVQLVELAAYDRILDASLETAYRDLARKHVSPSREIHRNLREIRVDLARFSDELQNITKFFGDWHLARIYQNVSKRFHLADWNRIINEKLKTLGQLYQLLQQDRVNFWMVVLEFTIVLLFIIDVLLLLLD